MLGCDEVRPAARHDIPVVALLELALIVLLESFDFFAEIARRRLRNVLNGPHEMPTPCFLYPHIRLFERAGLLLLGPLFDFFIHNIVLDDFFGDAERLNLQPPTCLTLTITHK